MGNGNRTFQFDHVHTGDATQEEVFDSLTDLVEGFLEGYNSTVFAYGQTGSGKTYTMGTSADQLHAEGGVGVIPQFLDLVFKHVNSKCLEYTMRLSFVELHNEELRDLLDERQDKPIVLRETSKGAVLIQARRRMPALFCIVLFLSKQKHF
eukprot:6652437-Pyramimonas_sp.AAC.1